MHRIDNYGSVLQSFALQHTIEKMGLEVEIIDYNYPNLFQFKRGVHQPVYNWKTKVIRLLGSLHAHNRLRHKFEAFRQHYYHLSPYFSDYEAIHNSSLNYDLYITGSDQVWNPFLQRATLLSCWIS